MTGELFSLSRKEGWRRFADAPPRQRPELLSVSELARLGEAAREEYDETRHDWHANFGILRTPQLAAVCDELDLIVSSCCTHLTLPGPEPGDLDMSVLHRLLIGDQLPPGAAAGRLGTTISHVRLAAEYIARPGPRWSPRGGSNPAARQRHKQASGLLTREFFEREYLRLGKNLNVIAAETGFNRAILADHARHAGITLRRAREPFPVDATWLREQYEQRKRPVASIAAELGISDETIRRRLHQHGVAARPAGVHSRHGILTIPDGLPPVIQQAVGGSLHGWLRLQRFQAAMQYPGIGRAASALGVHASALISQFSRLERDTGQQLYHRGSSDTPMRPTPAGTELLDALRQDDVAALMNQHAKAPASPRRPRPPRYGPRKPTPAERKAAFYSTLSIRRVVITPQACAALHVLLRAGTTDPQGIDLLEICARSQLSRNTTYHLLTKLVSARWVRRRPESLQSRRSRAGPGKGGPPHMWYSLTSDGHSAAVHELNERAPASAATSVGKLSASARDLDPGRIRHPRAAVVQPASCPAMRAG